MASLMTGIVRRPLRSAERRVAAFYREIKMRRIHSLNVVNVYNVGAPYCVNRTSDELF